jgi:mRNA interferase MazF
MINPKRGEIWWVNFEPSVGTEIRKIRPALIISNNIANKKNIRVNVIPITSRIKELPFTVVVNADNKNNLEKVSVINIPDITTFDKIRLKSKIGTLSDEKLKEVGIKLKRHLGL